MKVAVLFDESLVSLTKELNAMKTKVNNEFFHRELRLLKRSKSLFLKKASERHIGTSSGDGMTGAPVTGLEYKHVMQCRT